MAVIAASQRDVPDERLAENTATGGSPNGGTRDVAEPRGRRGPRGENEQDRGRRADGSRHRLLRHPSSLPLQPPDDRQQRHGDGDRTIIAGQCTPTRQLAGWHGHERRHVVAGDDRRQRPQHDPFDDQRRRGDLRRGAAECVLDAAVQPARHEQRARLDVNGTKRSADEDRRQDVPRRGRSDRGPGHTADEEGDASQLAERAGGGPPHRHVRHQRARREHDTDPFRRGEPRNVGHDQSAHVIQRGDCGRATEITCAPDFAALHALRRPRRRDRRLTSHVMFLP